MSANRRISAPYGLTEHGHPNRLQRANSCAERRYYSSSARVSGVNRDTKHITHRKAVCQVRFW